MYLHEQREVGECSHYKCLRHPVETLVRVMLFRMQSFSLYLGHAPRGNPEELAKSLCKRNANIRGVKHHLIWVSDDYIRHTRARMSTSGMTRNQAVETFVSEEVMRDDKVHEQQRI